MSVLTFGLIIVLIAVPFLMASAYHVGYERGWKREQRAQNARLLKAQRGSDLDPVSEVLAWEDEQLLNVFREAGLLRIAADKFATDVLGVTLEEWQARELGLLGPEPSRPVRTHIHRTR